MTTVGKLQAALASATQETTLALANLNFDFSLVKVEAPPTFKPLGLALSKTRRSAAENGQAHVVARRLSSLFASMIPKTPNLVRAYGQRASDITASAHVNVKGSAVHGPFRDFVGVDGTSIWAAATSGSGAVAVHLLACMLARVWPRASEAVSIWEELVAERKRELIARQEDMDASEFARLEDVVASQLTVTREQLSEWDASARAWLRAADSAPMIMTKQKQVMLILESLSKSVSSQVNVYQSVCQAWETALVTMDSVVKGGAYSIRDGSVLVALSAWHLYPDLIVVSNKTQQVQQHDDLILPGGSVTIGWEGVEGDLQKGVTWSLSLAHLRYYGAPVMSERHLDVTSSRLSPDDLVQVALGSTLRSWGIRSRDLSGAVNLMAHMKKYVEASINKELSPSTAQQKIQAMFARSWFHALGEAAHTYIHSNGEQKTSKWKLLNFGFRHMSLMTKSENSAFLLKGPNICNLLSTQQHKIRFLRDLAQRCRGSPRQLVIRIRLKDIDGIPRETDDYIYLGTASLQDGMLPSWGTQPYADTFSAAYTTSEALYCRLEPDRIKMLRSALMFSWRISEEELAGRIVQKRPEHEVTEKRSSRSFWSSKSKQKEKQSIISYEADSAYGAPFELIAGDVQDVALFERLSQTDSKMDMAECHGVDLETIERMLVDRSMDARALIFHLNALSMYQETQELTMSLRALATIIKIYKNLPGANISPNIVTTSASGAAQTSLGLSRWSRSGHKRTSSSESQYLGLSPTRLDRAETFACIAMLETGFFDLEPRNLRQVMAISVGDSLYIAARLLSDPSSTTAPHEVRRVIGNIGRAGLALLIPPVDPKVRRHDSEQWQLINHAPFTGELQDCFSNTSLHLAFTGYEAPLVVGEHGGRFTEAFFIESVVSVHDSGRWLADLDILKAFDSPLCNAIVQQPHCVPPPAAQPPPFEVTAIDNWEELLEPPETAAVLRAHGNWQARLAAMSVCIALGYSTILFQGHGCWSCGQKLLKMLGKNQRSNSSHSVETLTNYIPEPKETSSPSAATVFIM